MMIYLCTLCNNAAQPVAKLKYICNPNKIFFFKYKLNVLKSHNPKFKHENYLNLYKVALCHRFTPTYAFSLEEFFSAKSYSPMICRQIRVNINSNFSFFRIKFVCSMKTSSTREIFGRG